MPTPSVIVNHDIAHCGGGRKSRYRGSAVESASDANYACDMHYDIAALLGSALNEIRKRSTGTQDRWTEKTGMSQSYLSAAERGKSGWESIQTIFAAIERAGVDPLDLFRLVLAKADATSDESQRELMGLWSQLDPISKEAILHLARGQAARWRAAR